MSPFSYYTSAFKKYADFSGRARRSEYWFFTLFNMIVAFVALGIDLFLRTPLIFYAIYLLAMIIPSIAITVRRLHDTDKSGWYLLLALIPLVSLILLFFMLTDGTPGTNQYGTNPKEALAGDDLTRHLVED